VKRPFDYNHGQDAPWPVQRDVDPDRGVYLLRLEKLMQRKAK
jgi:hypothetical protein